MLKKFNIIEAHNYECEKGKLENNITYLEIKDYVEKLQKIQRVMGLSHADGFSNDEAIEKIKEILEIY